MKVQRAVGDQAVIPHLEKGGSAWFFCTCVFRWESPRRHKITSQDRPNAEPSAAELHAKQRLSSMLLSGESWLQMHALL